MSAMNEETYQAIYQRLRRGDILTAEETVALDKELDRRHALNAAKTKRMGLQFLAVKWGWRILMVVLVLAAIFMR